MYNVSCKLISRNLVENSIGVQKETITKTEVPIIRIEDIYSKEFYEANEQGYVPSLRIVISELNYSEESELEYNGIVYSVIRTQNAAMDERTLICERKAKNVK